MLVLLSRFGFWPPWPWDTYTLAAVLLLCGIPILLFSLETHLVKRALLVEACLLAFLLPLLLTSDPVASSEVADSFIFAMRFPQLAATFIGGFCLFACQSAASPQLRIMPLGGMYRPFSCRQAIALPHMI